jgi:hypothetical protein
MSRSYCRPIIFLSVLVLVLSPGCFTKLDPSTLTCTSNDHCPSGYLCTGVPGKCVKARLDSGSPDQLVPNTEAGGSGADIGLIVDGPMSDAPVDNPAVQEANRPDSSERLDSSTEMPSPDVVDSSSETQDVPQTTPDVPTRPDADLELSPEVAAALLPNGSSCTTGIVCATGHCADGVCCNAACTGQCQVCNAGGTCGRKSSGPPTGGRAACTGSGSCIGTCDGSSDSCVFPGSATTCGTAMCSSDLTTVNTPVCNGQGACSSAQALDCGTSSYCTDGKCTTKIADENACQSSVQCQHGNCSKYSLTGTSICCQSGYSNCGSCVNLQSSSTNCGSCGNSCGTNRTCQTGSCTCIGYTLPSSCGGCGSWGFESGTTEGWVKDTNPHWPISGGGTNGVTNLIATTTKVNDGSYALAVPIWIDNVNTTLASVTVPICNMGSTISLGGFALSANIFLSGPEIDPNAERSISFGGWNGSDMVRSPVATNMNVLVGTWMSLSTTTYGTSASADHINILFGPGVNWNGTMYIDNVQLRGP